MAQGPGRRVLAQENRLRRSTEFTEVVRRGRRGARALVTVHLLAGPDEGAARVGLVVGKPVGGSVVRHRVARRLRHLLRERVTLLPPGTRVVVRAAAAAGTASSADLAVDLDLALQSANRPRRPTAGSRSAAPGPGQDGRS